MQNLTLMVRNDKSGKEVEYEFPEFEDLLDKVQEIEAQYHVLQKNTIISLVVVPRKGIFNEKDD